MNHPRNGERVLVRPMGRKVQRGESMLGQFIALDGEELLWDEFLHARLSEGAISWEPVHAQTNRGVADAADPS